jgi:radical SAM superfamily enzyme YgiQ (UPF0313 family)
MNILLITPPMTQLNTPYPAAPYLTQYLRECGHTVEQRDFGLELFLKLYSSSGLERVRERLKNTDNDSVRFFVEAFQDYQSTVEPVIRFLQGKDPSMALRIAARTLLPEGPRFLPLREHAELLGSFGSLGVQDKAKYLASLYIDDLTDVIHHGIDQNFYLAKYAESLAASQTSFSPMYKALRGSVTLIDEMLIEIADECLKDFSPQVVGLTCPFPGNVYGALKLAQIFKDKVSAITVMGGGFVNTELRELSDRRFFEFIDYLIFDDGERPFELLLNTLNKKLLNSLNIDRLKGVHANLTNIKVDAKHLLRTWYFDGSQIVKSDLSDRTNVPFKNLTGPTYKGLKLSQYVSMLELPNPMHRMWSDFRWNKMILAHGCYWKKCTFCDISLDYIQRFEPAKATQIVDAIERIVAETGTTGFHFVDEAAPPALLKAMSQELLRRKLKINWWGNLRFDPQFTEEVAELMSDAGCVAVTGGLEVASPRVLKLINKGIDIEQVMRVTRAFKRHHIYVHAYLMYGFPTQTELETIESLEVVRQLFKSECIDSAHWHRFIATVHSPVGRNPEKFQIQIQRPAEPKEGYFAVNEVPFYDPANVDHDLLGQGLRKALYNYMHGIGIDEDVRVWFDRKKRRKS